MDIIKIDSQTIQAFTPVTISIVQLKAELNELQAQKARLKEQHESSMAQIQVEIDTKKDLILQAKNLGVE